MSKDTTKRTGRPPAADPRNIVVKVRVTAAEHARWLRRFGARGMGRGIRSIVNAADDRGPDPEPGAAVQPGPCPTRTCKHASARHAWGHGCCRDCDCLGHDTEAEAKAHREGGQWGGEE